jgi:ribonuclease HII
MIDDTSHEIMSRLSPSDWIVGFDEVGRGSWAGPLVVGAAAIRIDGLASFFEEHHERKVDDSKKLSKKRREGATELISEYFEVGIGSVSHREIDEFGLSKALTNGATRAMSSIDFVKPPSLLLLDGKYDYLEMPSVTVETIVGGDRRNAVIACASIVAKVFRDEIMVGLDEEYPFWNFASNMGYPSPRHRASMDIYGLSAIHRRSWSFARPSMDGSEGFAMGRFIDGQMILFEQNTA